MNGLKISVVKFVFLRVCIINEFYNDIGRVLSLSRPMSLFDGVEDW